MINPDQYLIIKDTSKGQGVFAGKFFKKGEIIIEFSGKVFDYDEIEKGSYIDEHCFQVGPRTYLGPSGGIDDFFNHSCDPNAGLKKTGEDKFALFAIKDIKAGDEVTWDYSTNVEEEGWEMNCNCAKPNCRKKIGSFSRLPEDTKKKYIKLGIVFPYILDRLKK